MRYELATLEGVFCGVGAFEMSLGFLIGSDISQNFDHTAVFAELFLEVQMFGDCVIILLQRIGLFSRFPQEADDAWKGRSNMSRGRACARWQ